MNMKSACSFCISGCPQGVQTAGAPTTGEAKLKMVEKDPKMFNGSSQQGLDTTRLSLRILPCVCKDKRAAAAGPGPLPLMQSLKFDLVAPKLARRHRPCALHGATVDHKPLSTSLGGLICWESE